MLSAINFRRTRNMGGTWFTSTAPSPSSTLAADVAAASSVFSSGPAPIGSRAQFIPEYQFVLSNPITHMDRVITPVLRSRIDHARQTALSIKSSTQSPSSFVSSQKLPQVLASNNNDPWQQQQLEAESALRSAVAATAAAITPDAANDTPKRDEEFNTPKLAAIPKAPGHTSLSAHAAKPPLALLGGKRLMSAAVSRRVPAAQPPVPLSIAALKLGGRAASAGSRRSSNASSTDTEFAAKVASLEVVLQQERESRLRVQQDLLRLERLLEAKIKPAK
ncbi:Hypothetical protein, putative [Bodo saltans]|uniref:Uncharacterized protein n=1 Tax=Bodo saltans TaxID=75058 RepID=A0A0S4J2Q9_BODSA|nr:Hypothetical protein, putative [Bodo saltans]|eukprot:CUG59993.1 Hypothetical protein, putative [Bodo saltans]